MGTEASDRSANADAGQVSTAAAEVYEKFFVPALFDQFVGPILDAVDPGAGDRLLDIGTGTGVVARAALRRVGAAGSVVAVDPNDGMLAVAARLAPELDIRPGAAENLPIGDDEIDCVTCQFALMFFQDRSRAIREIARVIRPGGRVAVATWAAVEEWMHTDIRGWTLADHVDDEQFDRLLLRARTSLSRFVAGDGTVRFLAPALIATATMR